jgi:hypothetical protein
MSTLQRGSQGAEVVRLQNALRALGFYDGASDGDFGPDTEEAVITFQDSKGLSTDGVVGPGTWSALGGDEPAPVAPPVPQGDSSTLAYRCLALSGSFETSHRPPQCFAGIAGDFDGQGMSFGALQWNFGQGTLQPMLQAVDSSLLDRLFGNNSAKLQQVLAEPHDQQMKWVRSIQDGAHHIQQPWHDQFVALGLSDDFQQIEVEHAGQRFNAAASWCGDYGVGSERAVALMFDINVQNGSIAAATKQLILKDIADLQPSGSPETDEVNRLVIIANRRADAANPKYQADVRARKLCIATGAGTVHGQSYDIEQDFGITLARA